MRATSFLLLFFSLAQSWGQSSIPNLPQPDEVAFISWFNNTLGTDEHPIYNGATYPLVKKAKYGHQFFGSIQWQKGSVKYFNRWFFDIQMLYDITSNQLMVKPLDATKNYGILLDITKVELFTIGSSVFKRIPQLDDKDLFYEILYSGSQLTLLVSHVKEIKLESSGLQSRSLQTYFVNVRDKGFIELKNKKSLDVISANSKVITKEIKSSDTKFDLRKPDLLVNFIRKFDERIR